MSTIKIGYKKYETTNLEFVQTDTIPMLDWDWPNQGHKKTECVTITCLNDVIAKLKVYVKKFPTQSVRVYVTPGGVRAFFLGTKCSVAEFYEKWDGASLSADPLYIELTKKNGGFPVRISPKPNRVGDFVATYVCTLGAPSNPEMLTVIKAVHDKPISRFKKNKYAVVSHTW
jgi:hypothetical protein